MPVAVALCPWLLLVTFCLSKEEPALSDAVPLAGQSRETIQRTFVNGLTRNHVILDT